MGRNYNDLALAEPLTRTYFFITISTLHYAASGLTGLICQSSLWGRSLGRQPPADSIFWQVAGAPTGLVGRPSGASRS